MSEPRLVAESPAWKRALRGRLLAWYRRHRRDLPWRRTRDPYHIWVSEIMLQQTQVETVVPYYHRFLAALPSIGKLARADEHDVLRQWEGLGYYRRARQLHRAARLIESEHGGQFPRLLEAVRRLPGIGRYTAGAILSIAFDLRAPILEANTVRLFSRLVAFDGDPTSRDGQRRLWQVAEDLLPKRGCGDFNQALMELGSLVCTPRAPRCQQCPLAELCQARARGQCESIPRPRPKPAISAVREASVAVGHRGKWLLRRCTTNERWAGLWDFLRFPLSAKKQNARHDELVEGIRRQSGLEVRPPRHVATLKHGVTRYRITLDCFTAAPRSPRPKLAEGTWRWVPAEELEAYPLSVTARKFGRLLASADA